MGSGADDFHSDKDSLNRRKAVPGESIAGMAHIVAFLGWLKESWGGMSQLILGILAIMLAIRPKAVAELEEKPLWKIGLPFLVGIIAISGFLLSKKSDDELRAQVRTLFAQTTSAATKNDIGELTGRLDAGFKDVVDAIKRLPQSTKPLKPVTPPVKTPSENPPPSLPAPPHVSFTQTRGISTDPEFRYALQVTIQSDQQVPVAFGIECTGEVGKVSDAFLVGQGAYMSVLYGSRGNEAIVRFGYPQLTPQAPLVVTILSKGDIRAVGIRAL